MKNKLLSYSDTSQSDTKKRVPVELWIFGFFALIVTLIDLGSDWLGFIKFRESIIPITGWNPCLVYMFSLFPVFILIYNYKIGNATRLRNLIIVTLTISIGLGLLDLINAGNKFSNNPYLIVSKWRPVWTMIIPFFWILLMISPRVKKYCSSFSSNKHQD